MGSFLPTKELLQMIEERIPHGRFLTTAALLSAVLAVIVGSVSFLYHIFVLPTFSLVVILVKTGKIDPAQFGKVVALVVVSCSTYFTLEYLHRGTSRLMKEIIDSSKNVLDLAARTNEQTETALEAIADLDARVSRLEDRKTS